MAKQREALVTNIFTADPSAHVFNDKVYVYPSHDLPHDGADDDEGIEYAMEDYHILSMDNLDEATPCIDNGEALHMRDIPWVSKQMWAPDVAFKDGKYYLYFPARDQQGVFRLGVAVSDSPVGPFKAEDNYIPGSMSIDPAVFEENGRYYCYNGGLWGGQLEKWMTGSYVENPAEIPADAPALGPFFAELKDACRNGLTGIHSCPTLRLSLLLFPMGPSRPWRGARCRYSSTGASRHCRGR